MRGFMVVRSSTILVLGVLAACAMTSGCVIAGEAELPDLEVVNSGIAIPGAPAEADGSEVTLSVSFRQKPSRAGIASSSFQDVRVMAVNLAATAGISDLTFLRGLRILASDPGTAAGESHAAPVEIARYRRITGQSVGRSLEIVNTPPADVTALWKGSEVEFTLEVSGQLPSVPWTADVGMRVGATLTY